ncbi:hypothetical protein ACLB2K_013851 [Fragaria x ananassa]
MLCEGFVGLLGLMAGMEEMSRRLEESLVLTDREARGVRIRPSAVAAARLWRGEEGVTITNMEDNRFAARFQSERDMWKVVDREPWEFDKSLVALEVLRGADSVVDVPLDTAGFWVQIHKVPFKYLSAEVAEDIGSEVGQIIDGKQGREADRVGTFLRARVRLNFMQPLLRKSKIDFPGVGSRVVEFQIGERMYRSRFGDGGGESDHSDSTGSSFNYTQSGDEDNRRQQTATRENGGRRSFQSLSDNSSTVSFPLQIEGPGQDTASSPVKKGSHSTRVDIVEVEEKRLAELDMFLYTRPAVDRDSDEVITIGNVSEISECTLTGAAVQEMVQSPVQVLECDAVKRLGMMFKSAFSDGYVEGFSGCFQAMEHVVDTTSGLSAAGRNRKDIRLTSV